MDRALLKMAIILGLMSTIGPFAIDMYLPALPAIGVDLGAAPSLAQMTLTSYFLAFGVAQLFYGPASDMFGRKLPIYFSLGLFALASIGCAFAPTIEMLIGLRFVQGLGAAGVMSIPRAVIRDQYTGAKATRLMSTIMLVFSISPMLAPLVGSLLIVPFGWRSVFLAVTIAAGIAVALNFFLLPETLAPENRRPFAIGEMFASFGLLLRDSNFVGLTLVGGLGMSAFFTFLGSASFVYMDYYGLTPTQFSLAFALNAAGFFVASQFAATLMERIGAARMIRGATLCYAICVSTLFVLFATGYGSLYLMVGALIFSNIFMGLTIPTAMVLALEEHGARAGAAASLGGTLQMLMGSLAMVIGSFAFNGSPVPMLAIIAVCGCGCFVIAATIVRRTAAQPAE